MNYDWWLYTEVCGNVLTWWPALLCIVQLNTLVLIQVCLWGISRQMRTLCPAMSPRNNHFHGNGNLFHRIRLKLVIFLASRTAEALFFFSPSRLLGPALISSTALQIFLPQILSEGHQLLFWHSAAWRQLRIEKRRSGCCGWSVQLGASSPLLFIA